MSDKLLKISRSATAAYLHGAWIGRVTLHWKGGSFSGSLSGEARKFDSEPAARAWAEAEAAKGPTPGGPKFITHGTGDGLDVYDAVTGKLLCSVPYAGDGEGWEIYDESRRDELEAYASGIPGL
jgi:hypothetical protein